MTLIEQKFNKKLILTDEKNEYSSSPYGISKDWYMNCSKLNSHGIRGKEITRWIPELLNVSKS